MAKQQPRRPTNTDRGQDKRIHSVMCAACTRVFDLPHSTAPIPQHDCRQQIRRTIS